MKRILTLALAAILVMSTLAYTAVPAQAAANPDGINASPAKIGSSGKLHALGNNASSAKPATAKAWLPDPCNVIGVQGEYAGSSEANGHTYRTYVYEKNMTMEEAVDFECLYSSSLEEEGFQKVEFENNYWISYVGFSKNGSTWAEMAIDIVDNMEALDYGGAATWRVYLVVPEDLSFTPGRGSSYIYDGGIRCSVCNGDKTCHYCIGGICNYGAGYETCVICEGSDVCNVCEGRGHR